MKISLLFAWYDLWVGFFWDKNKNWLYILPVPTSGIILKLPKRRYYLYYKDSTMPSGSTVKSELEHELTQGYTAVGYWAKNGEVEPLFGEYKCKD
jgi:hypothetical protein